MRTVEITCSTQQSPIKFMKYRVRYHSDPAKFKHLVKLYFIILASSIFHYDPRARFTENYIRSPHNLSQKSVEIYSIQQCYFLFVRFSSFIPVHIILSQVRGRYIVNVCQLKNEIRKLHILWLKNDKKCEGINSMVLFPIQ